MNRTKKRAAKRAQTRKAATPTKIDFRWPFPLTPVNKIHNLKAYRDWAGCSLSEARDAVEDPMAVMLI